MHIALCQRQGKQADRNAQCWGCGARVHRAQPEGQEKATTVHVMYSSQTHFGAHAPGLGAEAVMLADSTSCSDPLT